MKTLWLLRHAKASLEDGVDDHDRPLHAEGHEAAALLGRHFARNGLRPDQVRCSSARRARETLQGIVGQLGTELPTSIERNLYLASPGELLDAISETGASVGSLLVVGHNPGIAQLVAMLSLDGSADARSQVQQGYPTGGLAELDSPVGNWADLSAGCTLRSFTVPKSLSD